MMLNLFVILLLSVVAVLFWALALAWKELFATAKAGPKRVMEGPSLRLADNIRRPKLPRSTSLVGHDNTLTTKCSKNLVVS
jgi:hypothetical protein